MKVKRILSIALVALFCISTVSISAFAAPAASSVKLSAANATLGVKETLALKATVAPSGASQKVTWKSGTPAVAKVDSSGKVTAVKTGNAVITATAANGKKADCKVAVKAAPTKLTPSATSKVLGVKETYTMKVTYAPSGAAGAKTFTTSNKAIATVDKNGKITAVKTGDVTITAKAYNGVKTTCKVKVQAAPTKVAVSPASITLGVKETLTLKTTYTPSTAAGAKTFTTSDKSVATVSSAGKITAVKIGTATITIKAYNGVKTTCKVTVKAAPTKVTAGATTRSMNIGETYVLKGTYTPSTAGGAKTFTSGNTATATVDAAGKITAKKAGTVTITIKSYNGLKATCVVTVRPAPTGMTLNATKRSMAVGESYALKPVFTPSNAGSIMTWKSANSAIAKVDSNGKVTAVKAGSVVITATSANGKKASCTVTVSAAALSVFANGIQLGVGSSFTLPLVDENGVAAVGSRSWKSGNTAVATVDANGKVTAVKTGSAVITVTMFNGVTRSCTVNVITADAFASIKAIVTAYNNAANATKKEMNFSVTRNETFDVKLTKVDAGNLAYNYALTKVVESLLKDVNKTSVTPETFKNGVGTVNTGKTPQNFLPVQNQTYMSALKPEYVKSASYSSSTYKITLMPETIGVMADAPQHHTGMDTLDLGMEDIAQYGTIDHTVSSLTYNGATITATANAKGLLDSLVFDISASADGKVTNLTYDEIPIAASLLKALVINVGLKGSMKQTYTFTW